MPHPLVSVVIAVYNGAAYLGEAIESVLAQDYSPIEIIVVDDGSTDETPAVCGRFPTLRYHYQANQGSAIARNAGVALAQGEYLAFLDHDDLWLPEKTSRQVAALQALPGVDIVFSEMEQFFTPELADSLRQRFRLPEGQKGEGATSATLLRRDTFQATGGFDPSFTFVSFPAWYMRVTAAGLRPYTLPEVLVRRRVHGGNQGVYRKQDRFEYARALRQRLTLLRAQEAPE